MGIYDRDYYRESTRKWWSNWGDRRVTLWLIGIMVGIFVLQTVTLAQQPGVRGRGELTEALDYYYPAILEGQVWRLFTWSFVQNPGDIIGVVLLMFFLYFIGSELETLYGPGEFLAFYLCVATIVSFAQFALGLLGQMPHDLSITSAVAPITAAFIVFACHYPHRRILLMFILPVPAWLLATGVVMLGLVGFLGNAGAGQARLGYAAQILGYAFAFAYYRYNLRVLNWLPSLSFLSASRRRPKLRVFQEPRDERKPVGARAARVAGEVTADANVDEQLEAKLDNVLEKVARYGKESLTAEEQLILQRASEIYKRRRGN